MPKRRRGEAPVTDDQPTETEQEQGEEREQEQEQQSGDAGGDDEVAKARKAAEEEEAAKEKVKELEDDPPAKLEDWPDDKAKYETFGGAEGQESYEESVTSKLGPSSLRYREDGGVEIEGEEVDDPDEYKSEPIPGGPTDPRIKDARAYGEPDLTDETSIDPDSAISEDDDSDDEGSGEGSEDDSGDEGSSQGESEDSERSAGS
jgi:hypothetical protein